MNKTKVKINDIDEFCKLYKINIPVEAEFDYYIETLKKSSEFNWPGRNIDEKILTFSELEEHASKEGFESVRDYKNKCLDSLKDYITSTEAYKKLIAVELPKSKFQSRDWTNQERGFDLEMFMSIDFQSANYNVLKTFDSAQELESSWVDLCNKFDVHEGLVKSKSFRQIVFGNTNPKRLQTLQQEKIAKIVEHLKADGVADEKIVFISHDEIIIKVKTANWVHGFLNNKLSTIEKMVDMPIRISLSDLQKIKKNVFVKSVYMLNPNHSDSNYHFSKEYDTLHGVPGHKFYMYFKQHILHLPIDERDLTYYSDGELCKWVPEGEKNKKTQLPHYEKPDNVVSMKEAQEDYSYIWNGLTTVLPDMSDEEKRRAIEVVANTCKYCHSDSVGCQCWNDE